MAEDTLDFKDMMLQVYDQAIATTESLLTKQREFRAKLGLQLAESDENNQHFRVVVESHWKNEGEKGFDGVWQGTLQFALRQSISAVRTDGQCSVISVKILLPDEPNLFGKPTELNVPQSIWKQFEPKFD